MIMAGLPVDLNFHCLPVVGDCHYPNSKGLYTHYITRWWQLKYFLEFSPLFREDEPILTNIFQMG